MVHCYYYLALCREKRDGRKFKLYCLGSPSLIGFCGETWGFFFNNVKHK